MRKCTFSGEEDETLEYRGIIITGTSGSGKSTIARKICEKNSSFQIVKAVTTRLSRKDDFDGQYEYLKKNAFEDLIKGEELLINAHYRGEYYGIRKISYKSVLDQKKMPILVVTADSVSKLPGFFSFFVDAPDKDLDNRLTSREQQVDEDIKKQRRIDREHAEKYCTYAVNNTNLEQTIELFFALWEHRNAGGILPERVIRLMIECGVLLVSVSDPGNIKGASYDLTVGDEYYSKGRIRTLTNKDPFIRLDPYDYVIVTSSENANLPKDVAARFGLSVGLFCQGVILSNGPQVDPGFKGKLFCLLFNTSNSPVVLKRRQHHATIEFTKLLEPTCAYEGKYQGKIGIIHYLPSNTLKGAVSELKEELEKVKSESQKLNTTVLGVISVLLAIIAILLTLR